LSRKGEKTATKRERERERERERDGKKERRPRVIFDGNSRAPGEIEFLLAPVSCGIIERSGGGRIIFKKALSAAHDASGSDGEPWNKYFILNRPNERSYTMRFAALFGAKQRFADWLEFKTRLKRCREICATGKSGGLVLLTLRCAPIDFFHLI